MPAARPMHTDGKSIADEINRAAGALLEAVEAPSAHVAHVANTGVVSPANIAYTQADQTALATCVKALVVAVNALLDSQQAAGLMASS